MCRAKKVRAIGGEKAALARAVWCAMGRSQGGADSGLKSSELYINMRNYALDICLSSLSPLPDRCTHRHGVNGSAPPPTWTGPRSATHQARTRCKISRFCRQLSNVKQTHSPRFRVENCPSELAWGNLCSRADLRREHSVLGVDFSSYGELRRVYSVDIAVNRSE